MKRELEKQRPRHPPDRSPGAFEEIVRVEVFAVHPSEKPEDMPVITGFRSAPSDPREPREESREPRSDRSDPRES